MIAPCNYHDEVILPADIARVRLIISSDSCLGLRRGEGIPCLLKCTSDHDTPLFMLPKASHHIQNESKLLRDGPLRLYMI